MQIGKLNDESYSGSVERPMLEEFSQNRDSDEKRDTEERTEELDDG